MAGVVRAAILCVLRRAHVDYNIPARGVDVYRGGVLVLGLKSHRHACFKDLYAALKRPAVIERSSPPPSTKSTLVYGNFDLVYCHKAHFT